MPEVRSAHDVFLRRREFLKRLGIGVAGLSLPGLSTVACDSRGRAVRGGLQGGAPPNFVFFLIDDLGWKDIGAFGSTFHLTPNIDRLAASGMRFTDAYAASPVCSPTRASIMTGRHPARLDITDWIGGSQRGELLPAEYEDHLPPEEVTLGELLGDEGYATGYFGKWHLGDVPHYPESQGFDVNVGGTAAGQPASYFFPYKAREGRSPFWDVPGLEDGEEGEYLTDRLTDEALAFLATHQEDPFLLYLSHFAVHTPIQSKDELTARYEARRDSLASGEGSSQESEHGRAQTRLVQDHPAYAGMVQSVDESVGRVLDRLEELGLAENTVVIFMSDNGGLSTVAGDRIGPTANVPLRAGKGWLYEGGIRVPMIVSWPGRIEAGSVTGVPVQSTDFFPTMMEMAGISVAPNGPLDGSSLVPLLTASGEIQRDALYWHFPHYHGSGNRPSGAIRQGRWKLVEWFEDGEVELYDLESDLPERVDVSGSEPDRVAELLEKLRAWRDAVGANMPRLDTGAREEETS
ncbi:MAG: sulfatase [Gemmatimonadetes bacterium]|nr:sulfatase [Gemmatimonadota bacterium]NNM05266.1 sulfatase [Gemmatimonadota bacterium]